MKNAKFNFYHGSKAANVLAIGSTVLAITSPNSEASQHITKDSFDRVKQSNVLEYDVSNQNFSSKFSLRFLVDFDKYNKTKKSSHNYSSTHKHLSPARIAEQEISKYNAEQWQKVNICEEGGNWHVEGSTYEGGLGISVTNWDEFGGDKFDSDEATATPAEQEVIGDKIEIDMVNQKIIISKKILDTAHVPDQAGCYGGW